LPFYPLKHQRVHPPIVHHPCDHADATYDDNAAGSLAYVELETSEHLNRDEEGSQAENEVVGQTGCLDGSAVVDTSEESIPHDDAKEEEGGKLV